MLICCSIVLAVLIVGGFDIEPLAGVNTSIFQQHSTTCVAAAAYMKHEKSNRQANMQYRMLDVYLWHFLEVLCQILVSM